MVIRVGMYTRVRVEVVVSALDIVRKDYDRMMIDGDIPCITRDNKLAWEYVGALYTKRFRITKYVYVKR